MTTVTKNQNRKPLEDFFFYEVKIENNVAEIDVYPIFDQDCSTRTNLDTKNSARTTLTDCPVVEDSDDQKIVDVAYIEDDGTVDFGFSYSELWDSALDAIEVLGNTLKEQGKI